ncbi:MAG: hypothetical protein IPN53_23510 [Comamonadaceae bacterium]|nr:hypothetical protein [Comamonadaceae bacterium]
MATIKEPIQIPATYKVPYRHILAEERIDDSLACIAMVTHQTLADIKEQAFRFGLPRNGPAWVYPDMVSKLLFQWNLVFSEEKEADSIAALPDLAILTVDWNDQMEFGRSVVWVHIRGENDQAAFNYILDPANWVPENHRVTADFRHLKMVMPLAYAAVTLRPDIAAARKAK